MGDHHNWEFRYSKSKFLDDLEVPPFEELLGSTNTCRIIRLSKCFVTLLNKSLYPGLSHLELGKPAPVTIHLPIIIGSKKSIFFLGSRRSTNIAIEHGDCP